MANLDSGGEGGAAGTGDPGLGLGGGAEPKGTLATPPVDTPKGEGGATPPADKGAAAPPAAKGPAAKTAPASAADPATTGDPVKDAPPAPKAWPDQWRELLAGDDKKKITKVARYSDPGKVLDALVSLESELSSGRYAKKLPTHYSAEELAEYRKATGIPDKPEDYDIDLGNGIVWGEADKPHIDDFLQFAHENHMTPEEVKHGLGWWASYQEKLVAQQDEADSIAAQEARDGLRAKWGGEETKNKNFLKTVLDQHEGLFHDLTNARAPDGKRLGDKPDVLDFLVKKFAEADPYARELPGNGQDPAKSVEAEMKETKALMADKNSKYWKGPEAAAIQARYRTLIELTQRAAAVSAR